MTPDNGPSWAAMGAAAIAPQRDLSDLFEVRIVADHDHPGGVVVMVLVLEGPPIMSWAVPAEFLGEVEQDGSNAIIRCRGGANRGHASLVTPPGNLPTFLTLPAAPSCRGCEEFGPIEHRHDDEPGPGEIGACG